MMNKVYKKMLLIFSIFTLIFPLYNSSTVYAQASENNDESIVLTLEEMNVQTIDQTNKHTLDQFTLDTLDQLDK